ncbi:MAG: hypothetical protein ACRCWJ_20695 [Casimicrobium sp.]
MSSQSPLFFEDALDALRVTVMELGGYKKVGSELRADMSVSAAETWLRNCLNGERSERLNPDQVIALALLARKQGSVLYLQFLAQVLGFTFELITDERAQTVAIQGVAKAALQLEKAMSIAKTMGVDFETLAGGK